MNSRTNKKSGITVVFCLPGDSFPGKFLDCWSKTLSFCLANGITPLVSRRASPNVYYVRNMCLGGDVNRGVSQKPFNGTIDYDYIMWIDSDMVFGPAQVAALMRHDADIVAGTYLMADGRNLAAVRDWNEAYFVRHGHFEYLVPRDLEGREGLVEVAYAGMGFMLVKRGVYEALPYPWFTPERQAVGNAVDFSSEDVSFCLAAQRAGFTVAVDPAVRVGHLKNRIL